jgi:transcriptional regulator with XRE-family HTH domain
MTTVLRELRADRALSMEELAKKAHVGYATVFRLEHGRVKAQPRTTRKLAKALKVDPSDLRELTGR